MDRCYFPDVNRRRRCRNLHARSQAIVDSLEEPERSRASGYYTSVYAVGTAVSILSAGYVTEHWGWQSAFIVAGFGICIALIIGIYALPPGKITRRTQSQVADFQTGLQ